MRLRRQGENIKAGKEPGMITVSVISEIIIKQTDRVRLVLHTRETRHGAELRPEREHKKNGKDG